MAPHDWPGASILPRWPGCSVPPADHLGPQDRRQHAIGFFRSRGTVEEVGLVHARTLLVNVPRAAEVVAEMVRLAKPQGWVAGQEPDTEHALCYPPLPAWDRLREIFTVSHDRLGADLHLGRRLTELFRQAGLEDVEAAVYAPAYPAGHSRRTLLPDLVCSMRPMIFELGLSDEHELGELDRAVRDHLADPRTLAMPHLLVVAWGRKPA